MRSILKIVVVIAGAVSGGAAGGFLGGATFRWLYYGTASRDYRDSVLAGTIDAMAILGSIVGAIMAGIPKAKMRHGMILLAVAQMAIVMIAGMANATFRETWTFLVIGLLVLVPVVALGMLLSHAYARTLPLPGASTPPT